MSVENEERTQISGDSNSHPSTSFQGRSKGKKGGSKNDDRCDIILQKVEKRLDYEDEFEVIGKNVANKLKSLSKETRIQTEKIINDVLYYAEIGKINFNTSFSLVQNNPGTQETIVPSALNIKDYYENMYNNEF